MVVGWTATRVTSTLNKSNSRLNCYIYMGQSRQWTGFALCALVHTHILHLTLFHFIASPLWHDFGLVPITTSHLCYGNSPYIVTMTNISNDGFSPMSNFSSLLITSQKFMIWLPFTYCHWLVKNVSHHWVVVDLMVVCCASLTLRL